MTDENLADDRDAANVALMLDEAVSRKIVAVLHSAISDQNLGVGDANVSILLEELALALSTSYSFPLAVVKNMVDESVQKQMNTAILQVTTAVAPTGTQLSNTNSEWEKQLDALRKQTTTL